MTKNGPIHTLFDWDETVQPGFTILTWSDYLCEKGLFDRKALARIKDLFYRSNQGEMRYEDFLCRTASAYAEGLMGQNAHYVSSVTAEFVDIKSGQLYPFAPNVFHRLDKLGLKATIISGSPIMVLQAYAERYSIDQVFGLKVAVDSSGCFTNLVTENPGVSEQKASAIGKLPPDARIYLAFGNSLSDLPLFKAAEVGIVINNKKELFPDSVTARLHWATPETAEKLALELIERVI